MLVLCNFLKILVVSDKIIHKAIIRTRTTQLYQQNPLDTILNFTIYQNYTLALIFNVVNIPLVLIPSHDLGVAN